MAAAVDMVMRKTAADKRRENRILRNAIALEIVRQGDPILRELDMDLLATDRVLQRWASSVGTDLPVEDWDIPPIAKLPPLDDETAIVVDQIILRSPMRVRRLVIPWYKGKGSSTTIAEKLGIGTWDALHWEWRVTLKWLREQFMNSEHMDLIILVNVRD
jgi:hypothetical protein